MPKLKTKSGAKKRFSFTASGKIRMSQAGKRHGMRKRAARSFIRDASRRKPPSCPRPDAQFVKLWMPYGKKKKK